MHDETKMDVYTSGVIGAEYDAGMKQLMSNKEIIIPILQMTVPEFKTCSQEEILQCLDISSITKDDFVSDIPDIEKDLRLTKEDSELSSFVESYSIWICAENVPKKLQNTLTEYSFSKKDIIGIADEPEEDYDLLTVVIIRQGKETEESGIFDYLKGLFTSDINRIQKYSHIKWSEPFKKEAGKMTGFGDMIYERGIRTGEQRGMILGALMSGKTPEEVSKMLNLPLEEIKKVQEQQMTVNK